MTYLEPEKNKSLEPGINYRYFEGGRFEKIADISAYGKFKKSVTLKNIAINIASVQDSFAFQFDGYIAIPKDGIYNFYTYSDDGSQLWIGDRLIVDNDGSHNESRQNGKVGLKKGLHRFKINYFDDYMGETLEVGISSREILECKIPDYMLFRKLF